MRVRAHLNFAATVEKESVIREDDKEGGEEEGKGSGSEKKSRVSSTRSDNTTT